MIFQMSFNCIITDMFQSVKKKYFFYNSGFQGHDLQISNRCLDLLHYVVSFRIGSPHKFTVLFYFF